MTSSAHAYVRGSTKHFYEWLASARGKSLPRAPTLWISGDCHVGNLGPIASSDGSIRIELRDLDQTVIGSPAHDVVRLALSMAMAVRASDLPGADTAHVIEAIARGYERVLEHRSSRRSFELEAPPKQVMSAFRTARARSRRALFTERLGDDARKIPIGKRFWPLSDAERSAVEALVTTKKVNALVTSLSSRPDDAPVALLDAAYWVKGCSSLGLWRAAALVQVGQSKRSSPASIALLDIKEALPPLAPRSSHADMPKHQGERVVLGATALSPALGERMASASVLKVPVFVRELLPQDLKFELETLGGAEAAAVAHYLAGVVGQAHARQLEPAACARWLEDFRKGTATNLTAPSWLWAAVVDLVALHEGSYLEHCRKHACHAQTPVGAPTGAAVVSHHVTGD